jgi:hypothetical protein
MNRIIYIIAAAALFMHFARKPHKQSTVNTPIGVINTQTNHGTLHNYDNGKQAPNFAAGYEDITPMQANVSAYMLAPKMYVTPLP